MTFGSAPRWAMAATAAAGTVMLACLLWIAAVGPHDWAVLQPFYGIVFVAQPIAFVGLALSLFTYRSRPRAKAAALALVNLAIVVLPWLWVAIVT